MKKLKFLFKSIFLIGLLYFASQMITWHDGRLAFRDARLTRSLNLSRPNFLFHKTLQQGQRQKHLPRHIYIMNHDK